MEFAALRARSNIAASSDMPRMAKAADRGQKRKRGRRNRQPVGSRASDRERA